MIAVGDLVEWDAPQAGTLCMGTVAAIRGGYAPGSTAQIAVIEPLNSRYVASVGVERLRLVKEVTA